jgi:hypothetical protein
MPAAAAVLPAVPGADICDDDAATGSMAEMWESSSDDAATGSMAEMWESSSDEPVVVADTSKERRWPCFIAATGVPVAEAAAAAKAAAAAGVVDGKEEEISGD